jgi:2-polyprenyl-3-methyl-5-hydroxy-6-metoxy-1,4-benzoquinol methylase
MGWRDEGYHPNDRRALELRHRQLKRAATTFEGSRIDVVRRYARGKKVLDVGCVSHNFQFRSGGHNRWLHDHVRRVARECVGVDYDEVGIKQMREAGYDVVHADITGDLTPLLERGPFDVVVAGEIIEHLPAPQALLAMASQVLRPGGRLVITTPNPYAPWRQRSGALGTTWENVDHIVYAFPSGIAEMAERTGLRLRKYGTVGGPEPSPGWRDLTASVRTWLQAAWERGKGHYDRLSGERYALALPPRWLSPLDVLLVRLRGRRRLLGETSIYVLAKPAEG